MEIKRFSVFVQVGLFVLLSILKVGVTQSIDSKIVSVSLFKNGLGFVTSEGELSQKNGKFVFEQLSIPVHGTFWIYPIGKGVVIKEAKAFEKEVLEYIPAINISEILEANVGSRVTIQLQPEKSLTGKIISIPTDRIVSQPPHLRGFYNQPPTSNLLIFQTDEEVLFLNKQLVQQVSVPQDNNNNILKGNFKTDIQRKKKSSALEINAENPLGKGKVGFQYLTKGITWAPSCTVDISNPLKARIYMKAEIINEIEDLNNVDINFVSGFPNFQFSEIISPIAKKEDLATFLNSLSNPSQITRNRSVVTQQVVMFNYTASTEQLFGYVPNVEGQVMEELFLYEKKNVSLKKDERGYYPLYEIETPYEHIYEWKIKDTIDQNDRFNKNQPEEKEEIWHSISLTNTGKTPWTTSPATTVQSNQILGQDTLYYTSPGGKSNLRITQSVDIKAEQAEFEVDRRRNAAQFYGSYYDLVEVKGTLTATSYKNKNITLSVTKTLSGEVLSSSPEARIEKSARGLKKVNPHSILKWEVPIKPAEKIQLEYKYQVYIRN
ncbi:hypothetical protein M0P98_05455 [bacterium]|nr:hypothetical protein [bacterium]